MFSHLATTGGFEGLGGGRKAEEEEDEGKANGKKEKRYHTDQ